MTPFPIGTHRRLALVAATAVLWLGAAGPAAAQYQWRDTQGRMVFSDQPPPAAVSADRIVRNAAPTVAPPTAPGTAALAPLKAAAAAAAPPSLADRDLAWRKRMAESEEQEKKAAEAASRKLALVQACEDIKGTIRSLGSGQRVTRVTASGEREFIADAERLQRLAAARKSAGERC
ncbi:MAG: DUF4124 domain-containing protein [Lautropia sp.]